MAPVQRRDTAGAGRGRRAAQVLGVGACTFGAQGFICLTHPWIGVILTAAEVTVPLIGALVLLVVILRGSDKDMRPGIPSPTLGSRPPRTRDTQRHHTIKRLIPRYRGRLLHDDRIRRKPRSGARTRPA